MKCRDCGADSRVLATRAYLGVFLSRRRECFNNHLFSTVEVYVRVIDLARLNEVARGVELRAKANRLRSQVLAAPRHMSNVQIGRSVGLSKGRVRDIKAEQEAAHSSDANREAKNC